MNNRARLQKLQPATSKQEKPIKTFDDFLNHPLYGCINLTDGQLKRLEPYRKKWENETFIFEGAGSDLYAVQDIIF